MSPDAGQRVDQRQIGYYALPIHYPARTSIGKSNDIIRSFRLFAYLQVLDTLTHIVLGACIGEAVAGRQLGKKALLLGALAQNIPDIDFLASFWLPTTADLLAHRGFTHSFLFTILLSPLLAWGSARLFRASGMHFRRWLYFWFVQLFIHIFIDAFNAYGTGWFEPFSHIRVSFHTLFVADPLFSAWPALALIVLLVLKKNNPRRAVWAIWALGLSSVYLLLSIGFKALIDGRVARDLHNQRLAERRFFTTPTPLNNQLWYIVSENDSGYVIGYTSVWDQPGPIRYHFVYRNDSLLGGPAYAADQQRLVRFSQGYYSAALRGDSLVLCDLRFGEILGWELPHPQPVLYYYLQYLASNRLLVQRGRFAGWNKQAILRYLRRIRGI